MQKNVVDFLDSYMLVAERTHGMAKKWNVTYKNRKETEGHISDASLKDSF
jgi:hypothetical protein